MNNELAVLDLFSAAAGGWSLGMHRAGFHTVAACEWIDWRRALYLQNNPGVRMYDDVRTLTGEQLLRDLGFLPGIVVGSPPCQDVSPANTKGKGVEGERSGLYFEAARIIGEVRPRWFALENSANLRTRGADLALSALEELGYSCWSFVVRAGDIGANHERPRSWLIGCDIAQVTDADGFGRHEGRQGRGSRLDLSLPQDTGHAPRVGRQPWAGDIEGRRVEIDGRVTSDDAGNGQERNALDAQSFGHEGGRPRRYGPDGLRAAPVAEGIRELAHADQEGQEDGSLVPSLRQAEIANDGCGAGRGDDRPCPGEMGLCPGDSLNAVGRRADWSLDDLAHHLRLDAGLSTWVAQSRIAVGGPRGTAAASLIVEAFGDAVVPQIPEAIGRAILRTERALAAVYQGEAA